MKKLCFLSLFGLFLLTSLFVSCSDKIMGYSVVLWNIPEYNLRDCDVVPVYIKSNISHVYVVGSADGQKIEIPLWQLTEPVKKSKIKELQSKYKEMAHFYASVKQDGLPTRAEPVNTARQVYRLRKGEVVKLLYKGEGQAVMAGKDKKLEGDWYRILTSDGTQGWCFSYNLKLFETDAEGNPVGGEKIVEEATEDSRYNSILNKTWYPDSFRTMINNNNIDLTALNPVYNFRIDTEKKTVSLSLNKLHESWTYSGYTKTDDNAFTLKDIPIVITYKKPSYIVVTHTGESGKPVEYDFVTIEEDINVIIANEKARRVKEYANIAAHGANLSSSSYGTLSLNSDGTFKWNKFGLLVPAVISNSAKNNGVASVKYAVSKSLSSTYDGVITFKFTGMDGEVNFLYKIEDGGIRFEDATGAKFKGNLVTERGSSPLILYFRNK